MKKIKFPTAHSVLLIIAVCVAILTWIIPAGKYDTLSYSKETNIFKIFDISMFENWQGINPIGLRASLAG